MLLLSMPAVTNAGQVWLACQFPADPCCAVQKDRETVANCAAPFVQLP